MLSQSLCGSIIPVSLFFLTHKILLLPGQRGNYSFIDPSKPATLLVLSYMLSAAKKSRCQCHNSLSHLVRRIMHPFCSFLFFPSVMERGRVVLCW